MPRRHRSDPVILENLELEHREKAQAELYELAQTLDEAGIDVAVAPLDGMFHAKLEESADQAFVDVLNIVLEEVEGHALEALIGTVITALGKWAHSRKYFRDRKEGRAAAVIWGPDGQELRRVQLPEPRDTKADE